MSRRRLRGETNSRVQARHRTKSLPCIPCASRARSRGNQVVLSFRGKTQERLDKHLWEVHGIKPPGR